MLAKLITKDESEIFKTNLKSTNSNLSKSKKGKSFQETMSNIYGNLEATLDQIEKEDLSETPPNKVTNAGFQYDDLGAFGMNSYGKSDKSSIQTAENQKKFDSERKVSLKDLVTKQTMEDNSFGVEESGKIFEFSESEQKMDWILCIYNFISNYKFRVLFN